jgi:hypothetical protein
MEASSVWSLVAVPAADHGRHGHRRPSPTIDARIEVPNADGGPSGLAQAGGGGSGGVADGGAAADAEDEAVRDLTRARDDAREDS